LKFSAQIGYIVSLKSMFHLEKRGVNKKAENVTRGEYMKRNNYNYNK